MKVNIVRVFIFLCAGLAVLTFAGCASVEPEVAEPVEPGRHRGSSRTGTSR